MESKRIHLKYFWLVFVLILLLPVVKEWRCFLFGDKVEGTYVHQKDIPIELFSGPTKEKVPKAEISYQFDGEEHLVYTTPYLPYERGESFPMKIHPSHQKRFVILTLKGFLVRPQTAVLVIVQLIWTALFFTLRQLKLKQI